MNVRRDLQRHGGIRPPPLGKSLARVLTLIVTPLLAVVPPWPALLADGAAGVANAATSRPASPNRVSVVNGVPIVMLDDATQKQGGIRSEPLASVRYGAQTVAYGVVLDLRPLIALRTRYATARADAEAARATADASREEAERSRILYEDERNVSLKAYQEAAAKYRGDQARADAAGVTGQDLRNIARQQFGAKLERWALAPGSTDFARLVSGGDTLFIITLPSGNDAAAPAHIRIASGAGPPLPADLISASPQGDPAIQGRPFIYRASIPVPGGTQVIAYLPAPGVTTGGVVIPRDAIVWYGGAEWAYVQVDANHFERRRVAQSRSMEGGLFVTEGVKAGERVVTRGAQLLLSEELRPPPGAACKDPECD